MDHGEYKGEAFVYSHKEVLGLLNNMAEKLLQKKESDFIGKKLYLEEGRQHYHGRLWIPDDLETIEI